jgi:hypothetical protein
MAIDITGVLATTDGAIGAVKNPEGVGVLITRSVLYVGTQSTGAANLSCGVAATATTAATDIINAIAVGGGVRDDVRGDGDVEGMKFWKERKLVSRT